MAKNDDNRSQASQVESEPTDSANPNEPSSLMDVRRILLSALVLGLLGTGLELLLLDHVERFAQWAPLALILLSLAAIGWFILSGGGASLRVLRAAMIAAIASGFAGFYFHFQGSAEFKLESNPSLAGWDLFWAAMRSKAPPPLAPGVMILLGLVGLAFAHRHPALKSIRKEK